MTTTIQRLTQTIPQARPIDRILIAITQSKRQVMAACDQCETAVALTARQPRR